MSIEIYDTLVSQQGWEEWFPPLLYQQWGLLLQQHIPSHTWQRAFFYSGCGNTEGSYNPRRKLSWRT